MRQRKWEIDRRRRRRKKNVKMAKAQKKSA